jgi:hypothetical protein
MLTVGQHIDLMKHGVGEEPDTRHNLYATFNRAGRRLFTETQWSWRLVAPVTIVGDGENHLLLPDDFSEIHGLNPADYGSVNWLDTASVLDMITRYPGAVYGRWSIGATAVGQLDGAGVYRQKLIVYPAPASTDTFTLSYFRVWPEIPADNTSDGRLPPIPPMYEDALVQLCRAMAIGLQDQMDSMEMRAYTAELTRLKDHDTSISPVGGQLKAVIKPYQRGLGRPTQIAFTPNLNT